MFYNLILFCQTESYFHIILKDALNRHMSKELGVCKSEDSIKSSHLLKKLNYLYFMALLSH